MTFLPTFLWILGGILGFFAFCYFTSDSPESNIQAIIFLGIFIAIGPFSAFFGLIAAIWFVCSRYIRIWKIDMDWFSRKPTWIPEAGEP